MASNQHSREEFDKRSKDRPAETSADLLLHKQRVTTARHHTPQLTLRKTNPPNAPPLRAVFTHLPQSHSTGSNSSKARTHSTAKACERGSSSACSGWGLCRKPLFLMGERRRRLQGDAPSRWADSDLEGHLVTQVLTGNAQLRWLFWILSSHPHYMIWPEALKVWCGRARPSGPLVVRVEILNASCWPPVLPATRFPLAGLFVLHSTTRPLSPSCSHSLR